MLKVYFEKDNTCYLVAKFVDDDIQFYCMPGLEKLAKERGCEIVDGMDDEEQEVINVEETTN